MVLRRVRGGDRCPWVALIGWQIHLAIPELQHNLPGFPVGRKSQVSALKLIKAEMLPQTKAVGCVVGGPAPRVFWQALIEVVWHGRVIATIHNPNHFG